MSLITKTQEAASPARETVRESKCTGKLMNAREHSQPKLMQSDRIRPSAEEAAKQLIRSWCDYHPQISNTIDPTQMPGLLAEVGKRVLQATLEEGAEGFHGIMPYFIDSLDGVRAEFVECNQGNSPQPKDCGKLLEIIADYDQAYRHDLRAAKLSKAIESGEDTVPIIREFQELDSPTVGRAFPITRAGLSDGVAVASDFVEGLLTEGAASVIYGPSNCGKSFWILDLAVSVASGKPFRDELAVDQGAVVYVALEGSFGMTNRIEALKRAGRLDKSTPLYLCDAPISLLEVGHAVKLAQSVKNAASESALPCRLVILDTLSRAMAGGDENSGKDMTAAVASIDAIRAATGAHVAVVHHCGKDEARGARGHSSLRAAVDTEIEVTRVDGESISTVRVTKQRDMSIGEPMPFSLPSITLGADRRGKPITSCTVHHEDSIMAATKAKAGRPPAVTDEELLSLLPMETTASWRKAASNELGVSSSTFHRNRARLEGVKAVKKSDGWVRV